MSDANRIDSNLMETKRTGSDQQIEEVSLLDKTASKISMSNQKPIVSFETADRIIGSYGPQISIETRNH
jgi:hypothetical protein